MTTYKNRTGEGTVTASGGTGLSRPIGGGGKLVPGTYSCEIVAITHEPWRALLILAVKGSGEIHSDYYTTLPRTLAPGQQLRAVVSYGSGYIVAKNGGRYQPISTETQLPIGPWHTSLQELYEKTEGAPASTAVKELHLDDGTTISTQVYNAKASTGPDTTETTD